jgi:hypothetical protein
MNERIKQLAEQADEYASQFAYVQAVGHPGYKEKFNEKFAELIVRECITVCADRGKHHDGLYSAWASDCSERIGKHFGVEE